jgi:hypothetical protein
MTTLAKWAGICAVIVLMLASTNGMILAQDAKIFEGTLQGVDANAKVLILKAGDKEMQFTYTDQTELVGPQKDGQPVTVRQGSKLKVTYMESDKANIATKIEVTEL